MDHLQKSINALEREMQISQINPLKIIGGCIVVVILISAGSIWWLRPKALVESDDTISWTRTGQFILGIAIAMLSILWIMWNLFMYN